MARSAARLPVLLLLAASCLVAAPCAFAQATPATTAPDAAHAGMEANVPKQPLAWSSLSAEQQRMLAPVRNQWDQMQPGRQRHLAEHANHWADLPPQRQQQIQQRLTRWANMTPEQRRQLRDNARAFHDLTPEQRAKVRAAYERFRALSPAERKALRERWHAMPPAQRTHWANEHPMPMHPPRAASGHH